MTRVQSGPGGSAIRLSFGARLRRRVAMVTSICARTARRNFARLVGMRNQHRLNGQSTRMGDCACLKGWNRGPVRSAGCFELRATTFISVLTAGGSST